MPSNEAFFFVAGLPAAEASFSFLVPNGCRPSFFTDQHLPPGGVQEFFGTGIIDKKDNSQTFGLVELGIPMDDALDIDDIFTCFSGIVLMQYASISGAVAAKYTVY